MPEHQQPLAQVVSALVLADRMLTLAQDADRAGYSASATLLVNLAFAVFDETPRSKQ